LEFRKRRLVFRNFSLKNIKLAKPIWVELLAENINPNISFVDYIPSEHSYKIKPAYIEVVQDLINSKFCRIGMADDIIKVPYSYSVTCLSLQNFLTNNYYSEEIINALLLLYLGHAQYQGYLIFNTLSFHTVQKLAQRPYIELNCSIRANEASQVKAVIFPVMIDSPCNKVITIIAKPKDKTVELLHYNSKIFGDPENDKGNKIMKDVVKYVETHILGVDEEKDDTESQVSF
jgi:hypothetical protein